MNKVAAIAHRAAATSMWAATVCALILLGMVFGPAIDSRWAPVVRDAQFTLVDRDADSMTLDWRAVRARDSCEIYPRQCIAMTVLRDGEWVGATVAVAATGDPLQCRSRPAGAQSLTRLKVTPSGDAVRTTLRHDCHPLWPTTTALPEARIKAKQ